MWSSTCKFPTTKTRHIPCGSLGLVPPGTPPLGHTLAGLFRSPIGIHPLMSSPLVWLA
jgi:hypothetical protein